ncbi:MAG: 30S ribosomal protein S8 [Zetaproteobacteria bacterium]|nr:30S ribosomal protein S8 [Zetaproteobacteria bacterium]
MNITDPIADLLTRIRNGQSAGKDVIVVPASKMKIAITHLLKDEGFVRAYKCIRDGRQGLIKIALKYSDEIGGKGVISSIKRSSSPSRRYYVGAEEIPFVKNGFGIGILSTSQGVMTCREARKRKIGGEYLLSVY